jgi:hypothetical protein
MVKKALITGITGQDGSYLAEFLLDKGYQVYGIIRRSSSFNTWRINHLFQEIHIKNRNFIMEYGDLTDASGVTVYGASSPIGGNPAKLSKKLFDPEAPAISLKDWEEAKKMAISSNERFIIPKAEEQFLVHKYADEFASKFNIPVEKLNPKDVGLYGKLKESEFIPTRETVRGAEQGFMPS